MIDWARFVDLINRHQRFVLTTHIRPDCDALGSQIAMASILESVGKQVLVCNAFAIPGHLVFVDPRGRARQLGVSASPSDVNACEALIVLDTSAWAQLGAMADVIRDFPGCKMVLDHHVSSDDLGAVMFKDTQAEATGRLVCDAAKQLGAALDDEAAVAAFVALATDTGWFRFSSARAGTYRLAAELIDRGVAPDQVYRQLYENSSLGRLRLMGRTLSRAETELEGRLIHSAIEQADFAAAGATPSDSEDIINELLSVGGTQAALLLVEQATGGFKISFRSRCELDCARLAERFGGGGHRKAAGAFVNEPFAAARGRVLGAMCEALLASG